jgi:hypothetical protein
MLHIELVHVLIYTETGRSLAREETTVQGGWLCKEDLK